jgi:hypothetical protein
VYARVPDLGDGDDRRKSAELGESSAVSVSGGGSAGKGHWRRNFGGDGGGGSSFKKGHAQKNSGGNTSTGSEQGVASRRLLFGVWGLKLPYDPQCLCRVLNSPQPVSAQSVPVPPPPPKHKWTYPHSSQRPWCPNATIVLATGDGNVGQFNEDGFLGPVRTALKKGWKVESYAWEEGLSKAWMREYGEGPWKDQFMIIFMETFGADLV